MSQFGLANELFPGERRPEGIFILLLFSLHRENIVVKITTKCCNTGIYRNYDLNYNTHISVIILELRNLAVIFTTFCVQCFDDLIVLYFLQRDINVRSRKIRLLVFRSIAQLRH